MSDSLETDPQQVSAGGPLRRVWQTPLRDLLRGRLTARLDWKRHVAVALPPPLIPLVTRIVRRTRLWRSEKADVADELIAHFADGLAAGESVQNLISHFGDTRSTAKLIRRAVKRRRPLRLRLAGYAGRALVVLVAIDALLIARFMLGRPTVAVDYLAELNAPIVRVPPSDRAWPIYRQAILAFGMGRGDGDRVMERSLAADPSRQFAEANPRDAEWPALVQWLDAHEAGFEKLREAAKKPGLGFVLGPDGPAYDPELGFDVKNYRIRGAVDSPLDESLISVLLTDLNPIRQMSKLLSADLRHAREQNDRARVVEDLDAMIGMAHQLRDAEAIVVTRLVAIGIADLALRDVRETLALKPDLFTDADLIHLAHQISWSMNGETASAFFDLSGERNSFKDLLQRLYTDDGNGDGRLAGSAVRGIGDLNLLTAGSSSRPPQPNGFADQAKMAAVGLYVATLDGRRATENEFARLYELVESDLQKPLYAIDPARSGEAAVQRRIDEIGRSAVDRVRLVLIPFLMPSFANAQKTAERLIGSRDGTLVGIALELYRRRHEGAYPQSLDALLDTMLPAIPKDRITGDLIRFRMLDHKPVIYSVGVDRDDDGGVPATGADGAFSADAAAEWVMPAARKKKPIGGDWILFDGRPKPPTTRPSTTSP